MVRRSKLEIYLDVLAAIRGGTEKPTRIMCEANLSWKPFQEVLGHLVSVGLVEEIDLIGVMGRDMRSSRKYRLTEKGEGVVRYFAGFKGLPLLDDVLYSERSRRLMDV